MNNNKLEQQLDELRKKSPKIMEIIESCPYDMDKNIGDTFTEDIFMEKVFHSNDSYFEKLIELDSKFNKSLTNNRVIYIHGFSGIGKSTFLRRFKWEFKEYDVRIIDFQDYLIKDDIKPVNVISEAVKQFLTDKREVDEENLLNTFKSVIDHIEILKPYITSFYKEYYSVTDYSRPIEYQECKEVIDSLDETDCFIFYFLYLFNNRSKNNLKNKACIIIFDNLEHVRNLGFE